MPSKIITNNPQAIKDLVNEVMPLLGYFVAGRRPPQDVRHLSNKVAILRDILQNYNGTDKEEILNTAVHGNNPGGYLTYFTGIGASKLADVIKDYDELILGGHKAKLDELPKGFIKQEIPERVVPNQGPRFPSKQEKFSPSLNTINEQEEIENEKQKAATKIQANFRGLKERNKIRNQHKAVQKIQAFFRSKKAQKETQAAEAAFSPARREEFLTKLKDTYQREQQQSASKKIPKIPPKEFAQTTIHHEREKEKARAILNLLFTAANADIFSQADSPENNLSFSRAIDKFMKIEMSKNERSQILEEAMVEALTYGNLDLISQIEKNLDNFSEQAVIELIGEAYVKSLGREDFENAKQLAHIMPNPFLKTEMLNLENKIKIYGGMDEQEDQNLIDKFTKDFRELASYEQQDEKKRLDILSKAVRYAAFANDAELLSELAKYAPDEKIKKSIQDIIFYQDIGDPSPELIAKTCKEIENHQEVEQEEVVVIDKRDEMNKPVTFAPATKEPEQEEVEVIDHNLGRNSPSNQSQFSIDSASSEEIEGTNDAKNELFTKAKNGGLIKEATLRNLGGQNDILKEAFYMAAENGHTVMLPKIKEAIGKIPDQEQKELATKAFMRAFAARNTNAISYLKGLAQNRLLIRKMEKAERILQLHQNKPALLKREEAKLGSEFAAFHQARDITRGQLDKFKSAAPQAVPSKALKKRSGPSIG